MKTATQTKPASKMTTPEKLRRLADFLEEYVEHKDDLDDDFLTIWYHYESDMGAVVAFFGITEREASRLFDPDEYPIDHSSKSDVAKRLRKVAEKYEARAA